MSSSGYKVRPYTMGVVGGAGIGIVNPLLGTLTNVHLFLTPSVQLEDVYLPE